MKTITLQQLKDANACLEQLDVFEATFGSEARLTKANLRTAVNAGLSLDWVAEAFFTNEEMETYQAAIASIRKTCQDALEPIWKTFEDTHAPIWKAYKDALEPSWKTYQDALEPIWKTYQDAGAPILKAYKDACALIVFDILKARPECQTQSYRKVNKR